MISKIRLILLKALLFSVGGNVIIVIGGDDNYKNEDKEKRSVISVWARRAMSVQFSEEYLDGRKSFIFSWGEKHRPIHEEALKHFFDPGRNGERFIYQLPTQRDPTLQPGQVKPVGSITSRRSGNEPAILPSGGTESAAEIEPITPAEATPVEVEEGKSPLDTQEKGTYFLLHFLNILIPAGFHMIVRIVLIVPGFLNNVEMIRTIVMEALPR